MKEEGPQKPLHADSRAYETFTLPPPHGYPAAQTYGRGAAVVREEQGLVSTKPYMRPFQP
ncbi:hypothetical protein BC829DRAFT_389724 [Chytridium lagenaria]|nr:hypothetical protein BC829DRAFT_389724 [Chytridium lagenaria]